MAKRRKTGGRKKGTPNKLTQSVQEFIESVLTQDEAVQRAKKFVKMRGKNTKTAATVFLKLLEYRFGSPKQTLEHTGPDGGPLIHTIRFGDGNSDSSTS
jgi:hypothetical protein